VALAASADDKGFDAVTLSVAAWDAAFAWRHEGIARGEVKPQAAATSEHVMYCETCQGIAEHSVYASAERGCWYVCDVCGKERT